MGFSRPAAVTEVAPSRELNRRMVGIGMQLAVRPPSHPPPIEETLISASETGMDDEDLRVLSMLVTWLNLHHPYVNADRLIRMVLAHSSRRVRAFWAAVGKWLEKDRRFKRLLRIRSDPSLADLRNHTRWGIDTAARS